MAIAIKVPPSEVLQSALESHERGQYVDALRVAEAFAPLREGGGAEACTVAGRIATNTGAPRLANRLAVRAWRTDKADPHAQVQYALTI